MIQKTKKKRVNADGRTARLGHAGGGGEWRVKKDGI